MDLPIDHQINDSQLISVVHTLRKSFYEHFLYLNSSIKVSCLMKSNKISFNIALSNKNKFPHLKTSFDPHKSPQSPQITDHRLSSSAYPATVSHIFELPHVRNCYLDRRPTTYSKHELYQREPSLISADI